VNGLIRPLVVALRGGKDPRCILNKIGAGLYSRFGSLGEKQDILHLLGTEPRFLLCLVSILVNIPSRQSRLL
jgi:hypothetical protein